MQAIQSSENVSFTKVSAFQKMMQLEPYVVIKRQPLPAGVKSNGNKENTPATVVIIKVRKYALLSAANKLLIGAARSNMNANSMNGST
jgi:hypothetical protein